MSHQKGYTYKNIMEFVERYDCVLKEDSEYINTRPANFTIIAKCGHEVNTSFNKLLKNRVGILLFQVYGNKHSKRCVLHE